MSFFHLQKHCLGVFIKELQNTLNVTVPEEHMSIVRGIQANLNLMGEHREVGQQRNDVTWFTHRFWALTGHCSPVASLWLASWHDIIHDHLSLCSRILRTAQWRGGAGSLFRSSSDSSWNSTPSYSDSILSQWQHNLSLMFVFTWEETTHMTTECVGC